MHTISVEDLLCLYERPFLENGLATIICYSKDLRRCLIGENLFESLMSQITQNEKFVAVFRYGEEGGMISKESAYLFITEKKLLAYWSCCRDTQTLAKTSFFSLVFMSKNIDRSSERPIFSVHYEDFESILTSVDGVRLKIKSNKYYMIKIDKVNIRLAKGLQNLLISLRNPSGSR